MNYVCGYLFLRFKDGCEFHQIDASQTLVNLQCIKIEPHQTDDDLYLAELGTYVLFLSQGKPVGTPDPSTYYRILQEHDVAAMFVAPTAMRALRREVNTFHMTPHYNIAQNGY